MTNDKKVPASTEQLILELKSLEIKLGNLPNETWTVNDLQKRAFDNSLHSDMKAMSQRTELLFIEICEELIRHNFSHQEIAAVVNKQLKFDRGPQYCSESEVAEALS